MKKYFLVFVVCCSLSCDVSGMRRLFSSLRARAAKPVQEETLSEQQLNNNEHLRLLFSRLTGSDMVKLICAPNASDDNLHAIASIFGTHLAGLVINGSEETPSIVTDVGLAAVVEHCSNFTELVVHGCRSHNITNSEIPNIRSLEKLELFYWADEPLGSKRKPLVLALCKNLQKVTIDGGPFRCVVPGRYSHAAVKFTP